MARLEDHSHIDPSEVTREEVKGQSRSYKMARRLMMTE